MSSGLYIPPSACEHPRDELRCDLRSHGDTVRVFAQCLTCQAWWNEDNLPGGIIDKLTELLEVGHIRRGVL